MRLLFGFVFFLIFVACNRHEVRSAAVCKTDSLLTVCTDTLLVDLDFPENSLLAVKFHEPMSITWHTGTIYEDQDFEVTVLDYGMQGGGKTLFNDKSKSITYWVSATPSIILRHERMFYLVDYWDMALSTNLLKIEDPRKMAVLDTSETPLQWQYTKSGSLTMLDTSDILVTSAFLVQSEPYLFYSDEHGSFIGRIRNNALQVVHKFDQYVYAFGGNQQYMVNGHSLHPFYTGNKNYYGKICIKGNHIKMHYKKRKYPSE